MMIPCDLLLPGLDTNEEHASMSKDSVGIGPLFATDRHRLVPTSSKVEGWLLSLGWRSHAEQVDPFSYGTKSATVSDRSVTGVLVLVIRRIS
jgi:hypothetical protein